MMSVHFMGDYRLNTKVFEYLKHCYRYYVLDDPVISDGEFDKLAKELHDKYEDISPIYQKLVSKDEYFAATFLGEYPKSIEDVVMGEFNYKRSLNE